MRKKDPQYPNTLKEDPYMVPTQKHPNSLSVEGTLIDVFDIADHFNVHYRTAQRWTKNKWIPHYRVGKSIRYNLSEVMNAISSHAE